MKKAMRRYGSPDEIVTDKLGSYGAAARDLGCSQKQVTKRCANIRVENSHIPSKTRSSHASVSTNAQSTEVRLKPGLVS